MPTDENLFKEYGRGRTRAIKGLTEDGQPYIIYMKPESMILDVLETRIELLKKKEDLNPISKAYRMGWVRALLWVLNENPEIQLDPVSEKELNQLLHRSRPSKSVNAVSNEPS